MAEIKLTQGMVTLVDDEDVERLSKHSWWAWWNGRRWYVMTKGISMHRMLVPNAEEVDHKDGDGLNNQKANLRSCTSSQNKANSGPKAGKYKGVCWYARSNKWIVQIMKDKKNKHLGYFSSEEDAARAYDKAALEAWGEFAYLNFPEDHGR